MRFTIPWSSPFAPWSAGLLVLAVIGMLVVFLSHDVPLKRWVLPLALAVFSAAGFLVASGSGKLGASIVAHVLVAVLLFANALWVIHKVRYCPGCGATLQSTDARARCQVCNRLSDSGEGNPDY